MARLLYVYYRVAEAGLEPTVLAVRAMQSRLLRTNAGLQARLLRRPETQDGQVTLMETYAGIAPETLAAALHAELAGTAAALPRPRHDEWFDMLE